MKDILYTVVDAGSSKTCAVIAQLQDDGPIEIIGFGKVPSQGLKKGVVTSIHEAQESIRESLKEAARSAGIAVPKVVVATANGSHFEARQCWGQVRSSENAPPLNQDTIREAIHSAFPENLSLDEEVLHVIPRNFVVDGLSDVRNPLGMHALCLDVETACVVCSSASLQNLVRAFKGASLDVKALVMAGLASGEAVLSREEKGNGVGLVDMGGGTTSVAIFRNGVLVNAAVLPVGGTHFTNDLALAINTPAEVAERVKLDYGHLIPGIVGGEVIEVEAFGDRQTVRTERREVSRYLRDRAEEVMHMVAIQLGKFGLVASPPTGIVLTGGCANLPGIRQVAKERFNCHVRIGIPGGDGNGLPEELQGPESAGAVGALIWSIRNQEVKHRKIDSKKMANSRDQDHSMIGWLKDRVKVNL